VRLSSARVRSIRLGDFYIMLYWFVISCLRVTWYSLRWLRISSDLWEKISRFTLDPVLVYSTNGELNVKFLSSLIVSGNFI